MYKLVITTQSFTQITKLYFFVLIWQKYFEIVQTYLHIGHFRGKVKPYQKFINNTQIFDVGIPTVGFWVDNGREFFNMKFNLEQMGFTHKERHNSQKKDFKARLVA